MRNRGWPSRRIKVRLDDVFPSLSVNDVPNSRLANAKMSTQGWLGFTLFIPSPNFAYVSLSKDSFGISLSSCVERPMLLVPHYCQVAQSIVALILVFMVDVFIRFQLTAKMGFHNQTVLWMALSIWAFLSLVFRNLQPSSRMIQWDAQLFHVSPDCALMTPQFFSNFVRRELPVPLLKPLPVSQLRRSEFTARRPRFNAVSAYRVPYRPNGTIQHFGNFAHRVFLILVRQPGLVSQFFGGPVRNGSYFNANTAKRICDSSRVAPKLQGDTICARLGVFATQPFGVAKLGNLLVHLCTIFLNRLYVNAGVR